ncbi:hypothetical protein [endosymbiont of Ridgeia piscesae]|jgi:hypothetical protein|uniref:Limiting CO2-inducible protein B/C beta carbonyic anhydrase domain-containing protein n=1 Tax=endosymbiont of Ridgeia piscesae TaxID=54398 RepID=A0A0T5Z428_9GAMM|nr:hypothetical protein [endosymbiont of Ridgeia piscesae]KRT56229.1 hypothetical protein Ga0074115_13519 [endosymbiont of Ridgeia piscesae]KRT57673.1 hypothetical protein Ga0076813_12013 [endosymbiont of Ridgeia piscesae]
MYNRNSNPMASMSSYRIESRMLRYSTFVPKLYNLCRSLGFEHGKIMPSRAFCSDESQGYPIILIAKHFNSFPFNHGLVGGIVATDRHGPHAHHGKDLIIIHASHVGYDPESRQYGHYRRLQTEDNSCSSSCGKIAGVLDWYQREYDFARDNIHVFKEEGEWRISIDNQLLDESREEGLYLDLSRLVTMDDAGLMNPLKVFSTSKTFRASDELAGLLDISGTGSEPTPLGDRLQPDWYSFKRQIRGGKEEGHSHLEHNLLPVMPWVLATKSPMLTAAKVNTQVEFDRTYRSLLKETEYKGRRLMLISGLHIDISPVEGQLFPLTKFVPWAAYLQQPDGAHRILEQDELFQMLDQQSEENPDQTDLEGAIHAMSEAAEVRPPTE